MYKSDCSYYGTNNQNKRTSHRLLRFLWVDVTAPTNDSCKDSIITTIMPNSKNIGLLSISLGQKTKLTFIWRLLGKQGH